MTERFDRIENRKRGFKNYYNQTTLRCPPGYTWVVVHFRNCGLVKGYRKRVKDYQRDKITFEKGRKYGWERGPVFIKEDRVIETYESFNNHLEREQ